MSASQSGPDVRIALEQHAAYCRALARCGLEVTVLAADAGYPRLFLCLQPEAAQALALRMGSRLLSLAPATIYAHGMDMSIPWHLNTVDI